MADSHRDLILDQFTRQAVPFATAPAIRNQEALDRIVQIAGAGPNDTSLDVACGPGLLVCAFAKAVKHAAGIDLTPAMLDQARREQAQLGLANIDWHLGDATALPFPDESFSIVTARFAFHHMPDPAAALREMRRVCARGGRVVVADTAPTPAHADAFNAMERLRDPSHTRALPVEEHKALLRDAGLEIYDSAAYRLPGDLEGLIARSFPAEGEADRIRAIFTAALDDDAIDMVPKRRDGEIFYAFPVTVLAARRA